MNHDEWLERAETYALWALDPAELTRFEAHLAAGCGACEAHLRATRESLPVLAHALPPLAPPEHVRQRLLAEVARAAAPSTRARSRPAWLWWGLPAGALVAAGLVAALGWDLASTRQEMRRLEARVAALRGELAEREATLRLLGNPQVRVVALAGLPPSPGATARLLWDPAARTGLLLTAGLPPVPPGRIYELWAIAGAEPVPAGVFTVDEGGRGRIMLAALPAKAFDKFAVTLEPAGGVPTPSGPMHLLGSL